MGLDGSGWLLKDRVRFVARVFLLLGDCIKCGVQWTVCLKNSLSRNVVYSLRIDP